MKSLPVSGWLRISCGIVLLGVAVWFGFAHRSPWIIALLGAAFTFLYICGKWYAWRRLCQDSGAAAWVKALILTFVIQAILAGLLYFAGLGIGRLVASQTLAKAVSAQDIAIIVGLIVFGGLISLWVDRLEGGKGPMAAVLEQAGQNYRSNRLANSAAQIQPDEDAEFIVLAEPVTPQTLFKDYREDVDYTFAALTKPVSEAGKKPVRAPYAANDAAIAEAEARLDFTLPQGLRDLYKVKDGGLVKEVAIAKIDNPQLVFDDWFLPFGGYDTLYSLSALRTVHDSVLDYAYEDEVEAFPKGAKNMLILAQWYRETTFLDYNQGGEPRVGMVNFDDPDWEDTAIWINSFDEFFSKLARIDTDWDFRPREKTVSQAGPSASEPDGFWKVDNAADPGMDDKIWAATENRLGLSLPAALKPFLAVANGGQPLYNILPEFAGNSDKSPYLMPFPGEKLLGVDKWISLKELSDRLDFVFGYPPWARLWTQSERLIVIAGSFDQALMLDYRNSQTPEVVFAANLDDPDSAAGLGNMADFLENLRAFEPG